MTPDELAQRRKALGFSQVKLAAALRVGLGTVSNWEQGRREIPAYLDLALETLERRKLEAVKSSA